MMVAAGESSPACRRLGLGEGAKMSAGGVVTVASVVVPAFPSTAGFGR